MAPLWIIICLYFAADFLVSLLLWTWKRIEKMRFRRVARQFNILSLGMNYRPKSEHESETLQHPREGGRKVQPEMLQPP